SARSSSPGVSITDCSSRRSRAKDGSARWHPTRRSPGAKRSRALPVPFEEGYRLAGEGFAAWPGGAGFGGGGTTGATGAGLAAVAAAVGAFGGVTPAIVGGSFLQSTSHTS